MYDAATGHMCFAEALAYLKRQQPIARASWPAGHFARLRYPNGAITYVCGPTEVSWAPSSPDVLAEDWVAVINPASTHQGKQS